MNYKVGRRVGVGWYSGSCMHCHQCMSGSHHLCPQVQATIVGHRGGFATHIRSHWAWVIPLPEKLNFAEAGPLLCGGITVFAPLAMYAKPTDRVGIIGIGGVRWLRSYPKAWLRPDVIAGLTAVVVIPKAMAYATIAGLPLQVGLYTVLVPMVIYAVLGGSRPLSVSTTTTLAILAAADFGQATMAGDPASLMRVSATLTLLVGVISLLASLLSVGLLTSFFWDRMLIVCNIGNTIFCGR